MRRTYRLDPNAVAEHRCGDVTRMTEYPAALDDLNRTLHPLRFPGRELRFLAVILFTVGVAGAQLTGDLTVGFASWWAGCTFALSVIVCYVERYVDWWVESQPRRGIIAGAWDAAVLMAVPLAVKVEEGPAAAAIASLTTMPFLLTAERRRRQRLRDAEVATRS